MKRKILVFAVSMRRGGSEKVCTDLLNRLDSGHYEITLAQIFGGEHYEKRLHPGIRIRSRFPHFIRGITRLLTWLPAGLLYRALVGKTHDGYDIEIALGDGLPSKVIAGSRNPRSRKLAWVHMDVRTNGWDLPCLRTKQGQAAVYGKFQTIVCVSQDCRDAFIEKFGYGEKIRVIHNLVPCAQIREMAAKEISLPAKEGAAFVTVGRLEREKGCDRLLRVHKRLLDEGFRLTLWLVGEGTKREELERWTRQHQTQDWVKFLGYQENPYPYIAAADVMLSPSYNEALSTVVTEAVVLGKPVIATDCSGMRELLGSHDEYGRIVQNSEEGLYQAMREWLSNPQERLRYQAKALEGSRLMGNTTLNLEQWEALLQEGAEAR